MTVGYKLLGIMSGSSLDGVDLAYCTFIRSNGRNWQHEIEVAETIPYSKQWVKTLMELHLKSAFEIIEKDIEYGRYLGGIASDFIRKYHLQPDLISSHGHTIFHEPAKGFTYQLGNGQATATQSGFPVICDFRTKDILLGGQGAPLVPIGDELLFSDYPICLNIGGIANISFNEQNKRFAYDVCPANQVLNFLSKKMGREYDNQGHIARSGKVDSELLSHLSKDPYYELKRPKSLSNQYVNSFFIELVENFHAKTEDKMRTVVEHIAQKVNDETVKLTKGKMLVTGGGAHNSYFTERLKAISKHQIIIPEKELVDFKEAMVFAFMGALRQRNEANCLSSVTGAKTDCSSGVIFYP